MASTPNLSIILPCLNEGAALIGLLDKLRKLYPDAEIIAVDDGSTPAVAADSSIHVIRHPYRIGNGAAIKTGVRSARGEILVMMDADGQHNPDDIPRFLDKLSEGHDMVVGAREVSTHASVGRRIANKLYNFLASVLTGYRIKDLTSGFRAVHARPFRNFLYLLPNGFSYPTTSTMAFFRCGYSVAYVPIIARARTGRSKIRLVHDGIKFLVIILRIGTLFSPMRFFLPLSRRDIYPGVVILWVHICQFAPVHQHERRSLSVITIHALVRNCVRTNLRPALSIFRRTQAHERSTENWPWSRNSKITPLRLP